MASNIRILYNYAAWDAATVTESSDRSGRRGPNVLLDPPGKTWIASGDTLEWIKLDLGSAAKITCLGIFNHNLTSSATVTLEANSSDYWSPPGYGQSLSLASDVDSVVFPRIVYFLDQTYRYWRISFDDPSNPAGWISVGRIVAGEYYEFTRNAARGARFTEKDPSTINHVPGTVENAEDLEVKARFRELRLDFPWRSETERRKWQAIYRRVGRVRPVVIAVDPDNKPSEMSAYCYIVSDLDWTWEHSSRFDIMTVLFEEKTR